VSRNHPAVQAATVEVVESDEGRRQFADYKRLLLGTQQAAHEVDIPDAMPEFFVAANDYIEKLVQAVAEDICGCGDDSLEHKLETASYTAMTVGFLAGYLGSDMPLTRMAGPLPNISKYPPITDQEWADIEALVDKSAAELVSEVTAVLKRFREMTGEDEDRGVVVEIVDTLTNKTIAFGESEHGLPEFYVTDDGAIPANDLPSANTEEKD